LVKVKPMLGMVGDWRKFLEGEVTAEEIKQLRRHERTGRPFGTAQFISHLERLTGRMLGKMKPGPKEARKVKNN